MRANLSQGRVAEAPLAFVFASQTMDHAMSLVLGCLVLGPAFALFSDSSGMLLAISGIQMLVGTFGVLFTTSLLYRFFCYWLFGNTAGTLWLGLGTRPGAQWFGEPADWIVAHVVEAAAGANPILWLLQLSLRKYGRRTLGLGFFFEYKKQPIRDSADTKAST